MRTSEMVMKDDVGRTKSEVKREANDFETKLLRDRFRLFAISIVESEAKRNGMEASEVVIACIADLAFKHTGVDKKEGPDLQFCRGHKIFDLDFLNQIGVNPEKVAETLLELFAEMIFVHGYIHGDPHPGNILVSPGGCNGFSLVLPDHGAWRELDEEFRKNFCQLWEALVLKDSKKIVCLGAEPAVYSQVGPGNDIDKY